MSDNYCKECGQYKSSFSEHKCPPRWQAVRPEYGDPDDESTFYQAFGVDAEIAALELAERKFSDWEYPREVEIWVRKSPTDEWQRFEISVESVPLFSATQLIDKLIEPDDLAESELSNDEMEE